MKVNVNVDVLIPCAGNSFFLEEAIESVLRQSIQPTGIYVLYNASALVPLRFQSNYANRLPINYIRWNERLPLAESWNRCLQVGTSEWMAFLHEDDSWPECYLESAIRATGNGVEAVLTRKVHHLDGQPAYDYHRSLLLQEADQAGRTVRDLLLLLNCSAHMSALLFRRSNLRFRTGLHTVVDQHFADEFSKRGTLELSAGDPVMIREHSNSMSRKLAGSGEIELHRRLLENLAWLEKNRSVTDEDIERYARLVGPPGYASLVVAECSPIIDHSTQDFVSRILRSPGWNSSERLYRRYKLLHRLPEFIRSLIGRFYFRKLIKKTK
jgi:glycosyltransferase involved in cell wall biosynthesis